MTLATPPDHTARATVVTNPRTESDPDILSAAQRVTLRALAECILEGAPRAGVTVAGVVAAAESRLAALPRHKQVELAFGLSLLGGRLLPLVTIGRPAQFHALSGVDRVRCFTAWGVSRVPQVRSAHQAFRRLVMATHYAHPDVAADIGYLGPLHLREPLVSWEGAAPGTATRDDEPVARGTPDLRRVVARGALPGGVIVGSAIDRDESRSADVVVVGSGAGGAVAAARLAEAGFDVVLLEEGGYYTAADFDEREGTLTERLYADGALRATDDVSIMMMQGRTVGGSTTVNWQIMLRTPDYVLEQWAREHGAYGMRAADLAAVFDRVEHDVHARPVPDDAHSPNNRMVLEGARALGWRASTAMINAKGCVRSGFCGVGCRYDAKQGTLLTYVPRALAAGATLFADARVEQIAIRERDSGKNTPPVKRVTAHIIDRRTRARRHTLTVDAPVVVLAGGAVGTPVLLERSGLGGGGVGQWLRLHPTTCVIGVHDRDVMASSGIPLSTMCDEFIRWNGTDYGFWIECPPLHPSIAAVAAPGFGVDHAGLMARFPHLGTLIALTRDGAERMRSSGSVSVSRGGRVRIDYRLGAEDGRRVRASMVAAARLQLAAGAREVRTLHTRPVIVRGERELSRIDEASLAPNDVALFSAHVNGTCRMGTNPATSGADPDGQRHGVRGLYIADGSLLPTAPGVNPQETIMALATVVAERIAARHAALLTSA